MGKRNWIRLHIAVLAIAAGMGACSEQSLAPTTLDVVRVESLRPPEGELQKVKRSNGGAVSVDVERIGPEGGVLETAGHRLTVPAGAISQPVVFRMRVKDNAIEVDLTATGPRSKTENDVGAAGFSVPLQLELSYRNAAAEDDPTGYVVAWVSEDGTLVPLPSVVDTASQTVEAELEHFSAYTLAMPN